MGTNYSEVLRIFAAYRLTEGTILEKSEENRIDQQRKEIEKNKEQISWNFGQAENLQPDRPQTTTK
jgi:hypothetical protein